MLMLLTGVLFSLDCVGYFLLPVVVARLHGFSAVLTQSVESEETTTHKNAERKDVAIIAVLSAEQRSSPASRDRGRCTWCTLSFSAQSALTNVFTPSFLAVPSEKKGKEEKIPRSIYLQLMAIVFRFGPCKL